MLEAYPVKIQLPVQWGEMDAFQHVNNVAYFRYFESSRIAYLKALDAMTIMKGTGIGPILKSTECTYRIPLTFPDTVTVASRILELQDDRFVLEHAVFSEKHKSIAAIGKAIVVCFDYKQNIKALIPETLKDRMKQLESNLK